MKKGIVVYKHENFRDLCVHDKINVRSMRVLFGDSDFIYLYRHNTDICSIDTILYY